MLPGAKSNSSLDSNQQTPSNMESHPRQLTTAPDELTLAGVPRTHLDINLISIYLRYYFVYVTKTNSAALLQSKLQPGVFAPYVYHAYLGRVHEKAAETMAIYV